MSWLTDKNCHHEAGHAIAALISGGYVSYLDFSTDDVEARTDQCKADFAFVGWAGPWAQAYWEGNCTTERVMEILHTQSYWDWKSYEEARDPVRAAEINVRAVVEEIEAAQLDADLAEMFGTVSPARPLAQNKPPITPPHPDWDGKLRKAWPAISALAASLKDGQSPIALSNGQHLDRDDWRDYWSDPNAPSVNQEEC